jgi:hypothetical protein
MGSGGSSIFRAGSTGVAGFWVGGGSAAISGAAIEGGIGGGGGTGPLDAVPGVPPESFASVLVR